MSCKVSLTEAQRVLLSIIASVEAGDSTPQEASVQLAELKEVAPAEFKADYTTEDFQRVQSNAQAQYAPSGTVVEEPAYEPSESY